MPINFTLNTLAELEQTPTSDDIARKRIIIKYVEQLTTILCAGGAEDIWREWFHPCAGTEHPPLAFPDQSAADAATTNQDVPRCRAYCFTVSIVPITVHYFGHDIANALNRIHQEIQANFKYSRASEQRIWGGYGHNYTTAR